MSNDMQLLEDVKLLLGLEDGSKDSLLSLIIRNSISSLKIKLKGNDIPKELEFIVVELSIQRYNKLGTEGMKSESIDVIRQDFHENEWIPYEDLINDYLDTVDSKHNQGRVKFL